MDLVRNLPSIDRSRFEIIVCTFLERGPLAESLVRAGIEVVGPFQYQPRPWPAFLRRALRWMPRLRSKLRYGLKLNARIKRTLVPILLYSLSHAPAPKFVLALMLAVGRLNPTGSNYLQVARLIREYMERAEIKVVHAVLPISYIAAAIANNSAACRPLVMSQLSLNFYQESNHLAVLVERALLHRMTDLFIGNSEAVISQLRAEGAPYFCARPLSFTMVSMRAIS